MYVVWVHIVKLFCTVVYFLVVIQKSFATRKYWPVFNFYILIFAECDCNGRSDLCYFNQTLYNLPGSGGYCQDCRDFTAGAKCEKCKPNYFRQDTRDVCHPCNCDDTGMY